jgi:MFS family permease
MNEQVPLHGYRVAPPPRPVGLPPKTNEFAIAALIAGVGGGTVLGIWLALVALRQIRQRGQRGRWMAIVGLVGSIVWIFACVGFTVLPGLI